MKYIVLQVVLKEKLIGVGSNSSTMSKLQDVINEQAEKEIGRASCRERV